MLRLYIDEDSMSHALVAALIRQGHDVLTAEQADNRRLADPQQLEFAASAGRAIFSRNVRHFRPLHTTWVEAGAVHSGVILLTDIDAPIGRQLRCFEAIDIVFLDEGLNGRLLFLLNFA